MDLRGTILQPWHYHSPRFDSNGRNLWQRIEHDAERYAQLRFTAVWLPPSSEGTGGDQDVGYGIRNWYNLNGTKYGSEEELRRACQVLHFHGIQAYHDQVYNHLMGGDIEQGIWCLHVEKNNKNQPIRPDSVWFQASIPTDFPWLGINHHHFDAYHPNDNDCWALSGKEFERETNPDALMGCDLDSDNIELMLKMREFGNWYKHRIQVDGYRFDAVKHIRPKETINFLTDMRRSANRNLFAVGEYFSTDLGELKWYLDQTYGQIALFDFPLQRKFVEASRNHSAFDMRSLSWGTLCAEVPTLAVTFVHSHDDQPPADGGDKRGEYIGNWFLPHSYAMILLRDVGYPMVSGIDLTNHAWLIKRLMLTRAHCTYGWRHDRFDHPNTVGWSFSGTEGFDNSLAVVMTNGSFGSKWLPTGRPGKSYRDLLEGVSQTVTTNSDGWAEFFCPDRHTAVWVESTKYQQIKALADAAG